MTQDSNRLALWALFAGNFIIGTGVILPAGMLNDLSAGLGVSPATAGLLMIVGGLVCGFGAPLLAMFTSRIDRRVLLAGSLAFYAVGHGLSALAPDFSSLVFLRAATVISAAIFTPQAAATVGLMLPPDKRAAAVAFIFIGWSIASVAGMPCGSLIAAYAGWRTAYALMAILALVSAVLVWRTLPKGLALPPMSLSTWRAVFFDPVLILILLVTLASGSGQFTLSGYLVVIYKEVLGASPGVIALLLAGFGLAGVTGNFLAARFVGKLGVGKLILCALGTILLGLIVFWSSFGIIAGAAVSVALWGLGTFSSNSLQQSRLIVHAPALASASVALNTSTIYLGQAIGAATGARLIANHELTHLAPVAAVFLILAIALTLLAGHYTARVRKI